MVSAFEHSIASDKDQLSHTKSLFVFSISLSEHVDFEKNSLRGTITDAFASYHKLKSINLSQNSFIGTIPSTIGLMKDLNTLKLHMNRLTGSLPKEIFQASQMEVLLLQSNMLTGNIPSQIENLHNATTISLSHNQLRGKIPTTLGDLEKLQYLHLFQNDLIGDAPPVTISNRKNNAFIADCGKSTLICDACTMCCNALNKCQVQLTWRTPVEQFGYMLVSLVPIGIVTIMFILFQLKKKGWCSLFKDRRAPLSIYNEDSVYCLIFSKSIIAWIIYTATATIQAMAFYIFLRRSNFHDKNTAWVFTYQCNANSIDCVNKSTRTSFGWFILTMALIFFLGADYADSIHQLRKAARLQDLRLLMSGLILFFLTALAAFTTIIYNVALAASDTDLVINAVFLLFINDMDERFLDLLDSLVPSWVAKRYKEIREVMSDKIDFIEAREQNNEVTSASSMGTAFDGSKRVLKDRFAGENNRVEVGLKMLGFRGSVTDIKVAWARSSITESQIAGLRSSLPDSQAPWLRSSINDIQIALPEDDVVDEDSQDPYSRSFSSNIQDTFPEEDESVECKPEVPQYSNAEKH